MTPPNEIPKEEYEKRIVTLMGHIMQSFDLENGSYAINDDWYIRELYLLHNDRVWPRESNKSCGGCVLRTFRRVKNIYEDIINGRV